MSATPSCSPTRSSKSSRMICTYTYTWRTTSFFQRQRSFELIALTERIYSKVSTLNVSYQPKDRKEFMFKIVSQNLMGVFLLLFVLLAPPLAGATEEYAKQTGQACAVCHLDPGGGSELTAAGKVFADSRQARTEKPEMGLFFKGFRLVIGYLHFLTAIFWFGTILYVHLILKPAYAASGLPRGEVRVGIISMIVMGVTGSILTHYRVTSFDMLIHTRFGILLLIKIGLYLVMVLSRSEEHTSELT